MKKLVFVAHEFGLSKGHGGVASYLYSIVKYLLNNNLVKVWVLTVGHDKECDLLSCPNLSVIRIRNEDDVMAKLVTIQPDYVETMDYLGFAVKALIAKRAGNFFPNTVFAVHHHTASRESFEWNTQIPLKFAHPHVRDAFMRETAQMVLADMQISPSHFMAKYVKRNYEIIDDISVFPHYNEIPLCTRDEIIKEIEPHIDLSQYADSFNVVFVSRIEGRKNQSYLTREFVAFLEKADIHARLFLAGNSNPDEITGEDKRLSLFRQIPEKHHKNIMIFDFVSQEQQKALAAISDLCVLPSKYESFSIAIAETLLRGVPVMVSKNSGIGDCVQSEMTFDPFKEGALAEKLLEFYKLQKSNREAIWKKQADNFLKNTDPQNSIVRRLAYFENMCTSQLESPSPNWTFIGEKQWREKGSHSNFKDYILTTNTLNDAVAMTFAQHFRWHQNLDNKIVVLSGSYEYLPDLQNCVVRGLPIFIRGVDTKKFNGQKPLYQNLLDFILESGRKIVALKWDKIRCQGTRCFTDYVFINEERLDLAKLYEGSDDEK